MTRIKFRYSEIEDEGVLSFDEIIARQSCAIAEIFYFLFLFFATSPLAPFGGSSTLARPGSLSLTRTPCARQLSFSPLLAWPRLRPRPRLQPSFYVYFPRPRRIQVLYVSMHYATPTMMGLAGGPIPAGMSHGRLFNFLVRVGGWPIWLSACKKN